MIQAVERASSRLTGSWNIRPSARFEGKRWGKRPPAASLVEGMQIGIDAPTGLGAGLDRFST